MQKYQVRAALLLLLLLAACAAPPAPVAVEVTRVVEATRLVEVTRIVTAPPEPTYTPYPTHTPYPTLTLAPSATPVPSLTPAPTIAPTLTPATGTTLPDILAAFRAAGLEAESARAMTRDDYGLAPLLGTGYRFLIPSLCPDCGGRLYQFDSLEDRDRMKQYYDELAKSSAMFFSWTFAAGDYLLQLNGDLDEATARQYGDVLHQATQ